MTYTDEKDMIEKLREYAEGFGVMTCIISVEKYPNDSYGNIRIVTGNRAYIESVENYRQMGMPELQQVTFVENQPYETYIPKDLNFEDFCYHAAVLRQPMHTYVHIDRYDFWFDMYALPVNMENGNTFYCTYTQVLTKQPDTEKMADLSQDIAGNVLNTCIKLRGAADFRKTVNEVIKDIRGLCGSESCCILLTDFKNECCMMFAQDFVSDEQRELMSTLNEEEFYFVARTWKDTLAGSNCLIIKNEIEMEMLRQRNPVWYESLSAYNVRSLVLFPLINNGATIGYIWATNFDTANTQRIKNTLELTTFFLASEIASFQMVRQLRQMSTMDMLTGVYNRNAMNNRVDSICADHTSRPRSIGVVFADLNGLKQVNDNEGHFAGDMLLRQAAAVLRNVFDDCEIYRAGGDEFMIIALGLSERELANRCRQLHQDPDQPDGVSFAVGFYHDETSGDIRRAMRAADERMYEDKQKYYQQYPDRKKR
jgi:diguanylate cyclase (GGDEF)-like protein